MPVGLGPRFLIEAGFILAVAIVAGVARLSWVWIVVVMAAAWALVAAVEIAFARARRPRERAAAQAEAVPNPQPPPAWNEPSVRVIGAPPVAEQTPEPAPEPDVMPGAVPEPEPDREPAPTERPPEPKPPEPIPSQPRVVAVPPPPPEPVRVPEPEPEPELEPQRVVALASRRAEPREWNLWDLERIARDTAGEDAARDEERSYLLMYLRDFASPDGVLPADFDAVVRESFGDVLDAATL
jgi:hypothetical protein